MEPLRVFIDLVLHLDRHLIALVAQYDLLIYVILFVVIFAETGFVVTPFLPGDSLLFAAGALSAVDSSGTLRLAPLLLTLGVAAIGGNTLNYLLGRRLGARAFSGRYRLFKMEYLRRTEAFFQKHGGMAVILSRFVPIVRTFAPFVAGIGRMSWPQFQFFNVCGGLAWVLSLTISGFLFGNLPIVRNNFGLVTVLIIAVSLVPIFWALWRDRRSRGNA